MRQGGEKILCWSVILRAKQGLCTPPSTEVYMKGVFDHGNRGVLLKTKELDERYRHASASNSFVVNIIQGGQKRYCHHFAVVVRFFFAFALC